MAIPLDTFFSVAPETNFLACGYTNLNAIDIFFYISNTNELRVQAFGSTNFLGLVQDVVWVDVITVSDVAHVYYVTTVGTVFHFQYDTLGPIRHPVTQITGIPLAITISVVFNHTSTPNIFCMMLDDGTVHWLFTSLTADYGTIKDTLSVYNNGLDAAHVVTKPTIKIHPSDTQRGTVIVQRFVVNPGVNEVGFYVVNIPGVV